ncbi:MAG: hypothetical protein JWL76_68 [Thermoleophilia bacterium]|nr:hypothetical protein [Thermoleophilia bacterium]
MHIRSSRLGYADDMIRRVLLGSVVALALLAGAASAAEPEGLTPQLRRDHDRAIELALADPRVQDRVALRGDMKVRAGQFDLSHSTDPGERAIGIGWIVGFYKPGTPIGDPTMTALVDLDTGYVEPGGQALVVMPGVGSSFRQWTGPAWQWMGLSVLFLLCVAGSFRRGDGARMLVPLVVATWAHLVTLANVVPRDAIRGGNIVLFAVAIVALLAGSVVWFRQPIRTARPFVPRGPWLVWAAAWGAALAFLVARAARVKEPIDVAYASDAGARLLAKGVPVYGNLEDIPGHLTNGDTYGPIAYLPYLPGASLTDGLAHVAWSNVAMVFIVGALLFLAGRRAGSISRGLWAAATWTTCPIVAIGAVGGNNDVVVALAITIVLLLARRPIWRGVLVAIAASTKFLPALLGIMLLRLRGETRRDVIAYVASALVTVGIVFAIALRGTDALGEFWSNAVTFQIGRDSIASFWGLTDWTYLRYVPLVAAVAVAVLAAWRASRQDLHVTMGAIASVLALLIIALPLYWGTYVTWLVPPVLLAMLWRGDALDAPEPATSDSVEVQSSRATAPV